MYHLQLVDGTSFWEGYLMDITKREITKISRKLDVIFEVCKN